MRIRHLPLLAIVAVVFLAGCTSNNKGKIEGTKWRAAINNVRLEFDKDGSMRFSVRGRTVSGKYTLNAGDYVTMTFDEDFAGRRKHREKIVIKGDTLTMTDSDGTSLTFSRVGKPKNNAARRAPNNTPAAGNSPFRASRSTSSDSLPGRGEGGFGR